MLIECAWHIHVSIHGLLMETGLIEYPHLQDIHFLPLNSINYGFFFANPLLATALHFLAESTHFLSVPECDMPGWSLRIGLMFRSNNYSLDTLDLTAFRHSGRITRYYDLGPRFVQTKTVNI